MNNTCAVEQVVSGSDESLYLGISLFISS